jgi:hypothetical protein
MTAELKKVLGRALRKSFQLNGKSTVDHIGHAFVLFNRDFC